MDLTRRTLIEKFGLTLVAACLPGGQPFTVRAKEGPARIRVESTKSWTIGDITCTALLDGIVQVDAAIFRSADKDLRAELLERSGQATDKIGLDVNAYVLRTDGEIVLVDAGTRELYGPTLGKVPARLIAAGIDPASVTKIVLTHMHNDHVGGLTRADGKATYGNAELIVSSAEWDFWTSEDNLRSASDRGRFSFTGARRTAPAYEARLRTFVGKEREVLPGIFAIDLAGHSVGHTGYRIVSGSEQMIIWGDVVVSPQLQFAHPEWSCDFDADAEKSIASRLRIMDETATDKLLVAGMHLPFPGVGYIVKDGGAFRFESGS